VRVCVCFGFYIGVDATFREMEERKERKVVF
jgi:hypothetical protein